MLAGILAYGWLTDFRTVTVLIIAIVLAIAVLGEIIESWLGFAAKRWWIAPSGQGVDWRGGRRGHRCSSRHRESHRGRSLDHSSAPRSSSTVIPASRVLLLAPVGAPSWVEPPPPQ
jgi:hypothetical protein